jgi:hypothetical protein
VIGAPCGACRHADCRVRATLSPCAARSTLHWNRWSPAAASYPTLNPKGAVAVSTVLWFLFAALYFVVLVTLGVTTLRKGHIVLFVVGIIFPLLWVIGAIIGPTPRAAAAR